MKTNYQDYCDWYALNGNPLQDEMESEENAKFDDHMERWAEEQS